MSQLEGLMTLEQLRNAVDSGEIDTVVVAITDMQGRLQGKRLSARFFVNEVVHHGTEGCNYLLAVDVDMNTVDGYAMSSWERGYGDFVMAPDFDTLRSTPWQPGTALLLADLQWEDGTDVRRLASPDPAAAAGPTVGHGADRVRRHRAGVHRLSRHLRGGVGQGLPRPRSRPTSTTSTTRCWAPPGSNRCSAASAGRWRVPDSTSSRPRASATSGSTRSPSATPMRLTTCDNHVIYKEAAKEIAAQEGMALTFMAKFNEREGNSCHIHISVRGNGNGHRDGEAVMADDATTTASCRHSGGASSPARWRTCVS